MEPTTEVLGVYRFIFGNGYAETFRLVAHVFPQETLKENQGFIN